MTSSASMLDACSPVFWFGSLAGFGACLILLWAVDRHRRP
jgi:hypothetical protein